VFLTFPRRSRNSPNRHYYRTSISLKDKDGFTENVEILPVLSVSNLAFKLIGEVPNCAEVVPGTLIIGFWQAILF